MSLLHRADRTRRGGEDLAVATVVPETVQPKRAAPLPARDKLLADLRERIQAEVTAAVDSLLDLDAVKDVRRLITSRVDRIVSQHEIAVTRCEPPSLDYEA